MPILTPLLTTNPLLNAYTEADEVGKAIFLALAFLSLVSWAVLIHKVWAAHVMRKLSRGFHAHFEKHRTHLFQVDNFYRVKQATTSNPFLSLYLTLKKAALEVLNKNKSVLTENENDPPSRISLSTADIDLLGSYLGSTVSTEVKNLEKHLFILSTVVTLGPFLGLLGTVWGILTTFSQLSTRSGGQTNELILSGLAMALGTTIFGLLVAIPALVAYNYLKHSVREFQTDMEDFSTLLLATVEIQYRRVDPERS